MKPYLLFFIAIFCVRLLWSQVVINEYSCANLNQYNDNFGKYEDWIELYNTSSSTISLNGYYLSDDSLQPLKWTFPSNAQLSPNGFIRVWASGRNNSININHLHANFKLSQTKNNSDYVVLSNPGGVLIDYVKIKKHKLGHSRGRTTNGVNNWSIFINPTIGSSNNSSVPYSAYAERPVMSVFSGFYTSFVSVSLSSDEPSPHQIRYTLDGSTPTLASNLYTTAINISNTKVLKAVCFSNYADVLPSFEEYSTYFINEQHSLPVVSIAGYELDVLANGNNSLRPIGSAEYFDVNGQRQAKSYGEFNSHGQDSWINNQRSLDFVARDEMGYSKGIKEKLFKNYDRDEFQRVILRAAGDDNFPGTTSDHEGCAHLRDAYFQNLCLDGGLKLDGRRGAKAVVYLNGSYWGVYDIREIPDDHDYTDYNYNQGKYDIQYILTWGSTWAEYGGAQAINDWNALRNYIFNNNMMDQSKYDYVASQLDVESLVDYVISHSLSVSSDWLNYNTGWWRGLNPDGEHQKWGYILWDNDASFAYYINYTNIPDTSASAPVCNVESGQLSDPENHLAILDKLRDNEAFNQYYVSRYIDLLNTTFSCDHMLNYLDSMKNLIQPEMTRHVSRWAPGYYSTYAQWEENYDRLRSFVSRRCGGSTTDLNLDSCYNLTGPYQVVFDVQNPGDGNIKINSIVHTNFPWTGTYYGGIDVLLKAGINGTNMPFQQWHTVSSIFAMPNTSDTNAIVLNGNDSITAYFGYPISVNEYANSNNQSYITTYPTLTNDKIFTSAQMQSLKDAYTLRVISISGIVVYQKAVSYNELQSGLSLSLRDKNISPGVYFIEASSSAEKQVSKIIYQH